MSVPRISKEDLKARLEGDPGHLPVILDARLKYPYEHSTITLPGAVRVKRAGDVGHVGHDGRGDGGGRGNDEIDVSGLSTDRDIVAYDSDPEELVSAPVVATLIRKGYSARALQGGIGEWITAKFPTDAKDAPKQAPPKAGGLKG